MSGFDGSGNFAFTYDWVSEKNLGANITASKFNTQFADAVAGFQNCLTRDGQGKPSANIDWNAKKITNLANGSADTDAANVATARGLVNEWIAESTTVAWVSATQFKVVGSDKTATYHKGRRVKITHNTGGTTSYGVVTASSFSTDTTVTVAVDSAASLVSTVTAVSYGIVSGNSTSARPGGTIIRAHGATQSTVVAAAGGNKLSYNVEDTDLLSEYDAVTNFRFTPLYPGWYFWAIDLEFSFAGTTNLAAIGFQKNGAGAFDQGCLTYSRACTTAATRYLLTGSGLLLAASGDYFEPYVWWGGAGSNITVFDASDGSKFSIHRVL